MKLVTRLFHNLNAKPFISQALREREKRGGKGREIYLSTSISFKAWG